MKRLISKWLISALLLIEATSAFSTSQDVAKAVISKDQACQDIWLGQFDPYQPNKSLPKRQKAPERMGDDPFLSRVRLAENVYGYLWDGWTEIRIQHAAFLNEFLHRSPDVAVSRIRVFKTTDELSRLEREWYYGDFWLLELELPGTPGFAYIEEQFGFKLRGELAYFQKRFQGTFNEAEKQNHARELEALWQATTSEARKTLKEDLGLLIPELANISDEDLISRFTQKDFGLSYEQWSLLDSTMIFERLPHSVRRGIANLWAASFVAGNDSFNGTHWLLNEHGSDSASVMGSQIYSLGMAFDNQNAFTKIFSPFAKNYLYFDVENEAYLDDELEFLLQRDMSPSLRSFLANLTTEQIKAIAAKVEFPIAEKEIEGLLGRAASFRAEE